MATAPIVMPHLVLPPPMLPLAFRAPSTPTKPRAKRECPGAPHRRAFGSRHRRVQWALLGFDDEQPQRGLDSAETLEMLAEPGITDEEVSQAINARLLVVERDAALFKTEAAQFENAAKLWRECASVALLDPTPDWQARAWLDVQEQLEGRVGPLAPHVEETLRALFKRSVDLETSES